ncbi:hypothetical protein JCM10207_008516 [Rhodosporidiobolus poonsookiae]
MPTFLREHGLYGGDVSDLVTSLSLPFPPNKRHLSLPILARLHLHECYVTPGRLGGHATQPPTRPWVACASFASLLISPTFNGTSSMHGVEPLEVGRHIRNRIALAYDLMEQARGKKKSELTGLALLANERAQEELDQRPFTPETRLWVQFLIGSVTTMLRSLKATHEYAEVKEE